MTTQTRFVPVFHENRESAGLITTNQMDLDVEMPNLNKVFVKTRQNNISSSGASFQVVNTNRMMDGNVEVELKCRVVLSGHTYEPNAIGPVMTPPYHWSANSCGVDGLAVNKLISRLNFNLQNKQWSEENRHPELFDILSTQFDPKKLKARGIKHLETAGVWNLRKSLGNGVVSTTDLDTATIQIDKNQFNTARTREAGKENFSQAAVRHNYITIDSVQFSQSGGPTLLAIKSKYYGGAHVPVEDANKKVDPQSNIFYTDGTGNPLVQTVDFTIHEYLISPSLSNDYSYNPYSKSYFLGSYPFNLSMDFNGNYLRSMFRNLVPATQDGAAASVDVTIVSQEIKDANINVITFDSAKQITGPYQRTLYYHLDFQSMQPQTINSIAVATSSDYPAQTSSTVTTANLTSLPPYIFGWVSARAWDNSLAVAATAGSASVDKVAPYVLAPLDNVEIVYGSQSDVMLGAQLSWREIVDLTMTVVRNNELRDVVYGSLPVNVSKSLFNRTDTGTNYNLADLPSNFFREEVDSTNGGLPFFILPTAKLNFNPIVVSGVATMPEFNMGSNNYKSLTIKMYWRPNFLIDKELNASTKVTYQPFIALATKRVRSIPKDGQGPLADERVEFDWINDNASLSQKLAEFYMVNNSSRSVNDQLQYVGGGFFGDILSKIKDALPTIAKVIRAIRSSTSGHEGLLGKVHQASDYASRGLEFLGHGKVGRPRTARR